jgi:hypothetical protein
MVDLISMPLQTPLADSKVGSYASASADVAQTLAGRARTLYEMATGARTASSPATPANPQGAPGHDHSGPPYGLAFTHCLMSFSGTRNVASAWTRAPIFSLVQLQRRTITVYPWVKPFPSGVPGTPYSRGYMAFRAYCDDATTLRVELYANGRSAKIATHTLTAGVEEVWTPDLYADLVPGPNAIRLVLSHSNAAENVLLSGIAMNQIVRRSHT